MAAPEHDILDATALARWLLTLGCDEIALTKTGALSQAVVREAARRWPHWWNAELFGEPHREAEFVVLETLHVTLRHIKLMRRRAGRLLTTPRGRELLADPEGLFDVLVDDLWGQDPFRATIAGAVIETLDGEQAVGYLEASRAATTRIASGMWRDASGSAPTEDEVSWLAANFVRRAEACGVVGQHLAPDAPLERRLQLRLTAAGRRLAGNRDNINEISEAAGESAL